MSVDVRCRVHRCRIAVIECDDDGVLVLATAPETVASGYALMRWGIPWTGDGYLPPENGWGCPQGHGLTTDQAATELSRGGRPSAAVPLPLSYAKIRRAWERGRAITWP